MEKGMDTDVRKIATEAVDQLKRVSDDVSMRVAGKLVQQDIISLSKGFLTKIVPNLGVIHVKEVFTDSWSRTGVNLNPFRRAGVLQLCLDMDLPITLADVAFIRKDLDIRRVSGSVCSYIVANSEASRSLVSRLGIYAIVSGDEWGNHESEHRSGHAVRKHGRMSAVVSGAAPEKSKQEKISEARAATVLYHAGLARLAQARYMKVFNAAVEDVRLTPVLETPLNKC